MASYAPQISSRRTFAIISHPDAGKTTLTEKLLLYTGTIQSAGSVKGKQNSRHAVSDWMDIEKQRGISVTSSVLQFTYGGCCVNILDTPGHQDFSEDTYRTLMAADAAVMVIDGAKGVEAQTKKLFRVCAMRGIPIFTFVNKMDRETRDPFDLMEEVENVLGIRTYPMNWPIGNGRDFRGVFDRASRKVLAFEGDGRANGTKKVDEVEATLGDAALTELIGEHNHNNLMDDIEHGHDVLDVGDLLVGDEDIGILHHGLHAVIVRDEVRGDIALIELHALDGVDGDIESLGILDGNDAVLAHDIHGVGDLVADLGVTSGDGADGSNLLLGLDRLGEVLHLGHGGVDGLVDTATDGQRVGAGGNVLETVVHDGLGQQRSGGGAVTHGVVGLGGDLLDQLGAHVLDVVLELDLLGDGNAVVGDHGSAEGALQGNIAALGAHGDGHGVGQGVDALGELGASVGVERDVLSHLMFLQMCHWGRVQITYPSQDLALGTAPNLRSWFVVCG